jgi:pilus assembly protein CpaB
MKNLKALGLILIALLIGLAAATYATGWVSRQAGIASNKVVVAAVDIELGSKINAEMLTSIDWPASATPPGAFKDAKALQDRITRVGVLRGEPLLEGKLAPLGTLGGLSAVIAEGKRAMTVRVNDVVGVAGFALPGNYVDVMVNAQQEKTGAERRQARSARRCWNGCWCWPWRRKRAATTPSRRSSAPSRSNCRSKTPKSWTWRAASAPCRWCCATRSMQKTVADRTASPRASCSTARRPAAIKPVPAALVRPRAQIVRRYPGASVGQCVEVIQHGMRN